MYDVLEDSINSDDGDSINTTCQHYQKQTNALATHSSGLYDVLEDSINSDDGDSKDRFYEKCKSAAIKSRLDEDSIDASDRSISLVITDSDDNSNQSQNGSISSYVTIALNNLNDPSSGLVSRPPVALSTTTSYPPHVEGRDHAPESSQSLTTINQNLIDHYPIVQTNFITLPVTSTTTVLTSVRSETPSETINCDTNLLSSYQTQEFHRNDMEDILEKFVNLNADVSKQEHPSSEIDKTNDFQLSNFSCVPVDSISPRSASDRRLSAAIGVVDVCSQRSARGSAETQSDSPQLGNKKSRQSRMKFQLAKERKASTTLGN